MAFINPQTPLKNLKTGNYFYPLTNLNQIICTNNRLSTFLNEDNNNLLNLSNINNISSTNVAAFLQPYWQFRQWSLDSSTGTKTSFFEDYSFPIVDNDRTSNASYKILTTKNLTDADSRFVTLSTNQTITGQKTFNQSGYGVNISGWVAYLNNFNTYIKDLANGSLNNINSRNLMITTNTGSGQAHTHALSSHTHALSSHTHALSSHTHTTAATTTGAASNATTSTSSTANTGSTTPTTSVASNEISGSTSTLPPYLAVYMWKRTA